MVVNWLHIENVLTFGTFDLRFDGMSLVVVGPNGAGKSNIVRAVDLVQKGAASVSGEQPTGLLDQAAGQVLQSFAAARHHGEPADRAAVVRLAVSFTTPSERSQLAVFVRAAVLATLLQETASGDEAFRLKMAQWVEDELTDERLSALYKGALVLRHVGLANIPWEISYEFSHGDAGYSWLLAGPNMLPGVVRADSTIARLGNVPRQPLMECLLGLSRANDPVKLPDSLPTFDIGQLCPATGAAVTAPIIQTGIGVVDQRLTPFRRATELLDLRETAGQRVIPLGYVLSRLLKDGVIVVGEQLRGLGTGGTPPQQPGPYPWEMLASPLRSRAVWQLPLRLFELKNGTPAQRARFRAVQDAFTALAPGRAFDITFQATTLLAAVPVEAGRIAILSGTRRKYDRSCGRCGPPAPASSKPVTANGGGWSATCTTAPSSGW